MIHQVNPLDDSWARILGTSSTLGSVKPGDDVELAHGTYTGKRFINCAGDPTNPIRIASDGSLVILDGEYINPGGGPDRVGADGDMVFNELLTIKCSGIIFGDPQVWLRRSRGRGIGVMGTASKRLNNVRIEHVNIADCRNLGVMLRYADGCAVTHCDISRCGSYQQAFQQSMDWPAALTIHESTDIDIRNNSIHHSWTDGIMPWEHSRNIRIFDNQIYDLARNVWIYIHGVEDVQVERNLLYHTGDQAWWKQASSGDKWGNGIVINREARSTGNSRNISVINNMVIDLAAGLALWNNQKTDAEQTGILFAHNTVIAHDWQKPFVVRKQAGLRSVEFLANLFYHPAGIYGEIEDWSGVSMSGNGWSGTAPLDPQAVDNLQQVALANPDEPLVAGNIDVNNYATVEPSALGDTGVSDDYFARSRQVWTTGGIDFVTVVPSRTIRIRHERVDELIDALRVFQGAQIEVMT